MTDFDFGFTAVNEDELATVEVSKKIAEESSAALDDIQERIDRLYNAITPLLTNLKKNPDKDYIYWPDRIKKIEDFEEYLRKIYQDI